MEEQEINYGDEEALTPEEEFEDWCVADLLVRQNTVTGMGWVHRIGKVGTRVGLGLCLAYVATSFLIAKFANPALLVGSVYLELLAKSPLAVIIGGGLTTFLMLLCCNAFDKRAAASTIFIGHLDALYTVMVNQGQDRFMERVRRIYRKIEADGIPFTSALFEERLSVPPGYEQEKYPIRGDISSNFSPFVTWLFVVASLFLLSDIIRGCWALLRFATAQVL